MEVAIVFLPWRLYSILKATTFHVTKQTLKAPLIYRRHDLKKSDKIDSCREIENIGIVRSALLFIGVV